MKKLSRQTQKVLEKMQEGVWYSQEQAFADKVTFRLSNKIRELEAAGYAIGRERVAPARMDYKYKIDRYPPDMKKVEYIASLAPKEKQNNLFP